MQVESRDCLHVTLILSLKVNIGIYLHCGHTSCSYHDRSKRNVIVESTPTRPSLMATAVDGESLLPAALSSAPQSTTPNPIKKNKHSVRPLVVLLILVHLSAVLYTLPLNRVIESRLCQEHYELHDPSVIPSNGPVPEKLCKIDGVQRRLAWLQGIMETTLVVCGM